MMNVENLTIQHEPIWRREAALLLACAEDPVQETIDTSDRYGMSQREMREMLSALHYFYQSSKKAASPLLTDASSLVPFFAPLAGADAQSPTAPSIAQITVRNIPDATWDTLDEAQREAAVLRIMNDLLQDAIGRDLTPDDRTAIPQMIYELADLSDSAKLELIRFFSQAHAVIPALLSLLDSVGDRMRSLANGLQNDITAVCAWIVSDAGRKSMAQALPPVDLNGLGGRLRASVSLIGFSSIVIHCETLMEDILPPALDLCVGLHVGVLLSRCFIRSREDIRDWKAIADQTRWRMLLLLSREALYLSELAERLSVTPATISHHLNILLSQRLISVRLKTDQRAKRAQYTATSDQLLTMAARLTTLAEEAKAHEQE